MNTAAKAVIILAVLITSACGGEDGSASAPAFPVDPGVEETKGKPVTADLRNEIESMFKLDLQVRTALWQTMQSNGPKSEEYKLALTAAQKAYSSNAQRLSALIDASGWPSEAEVGEEVAESAFLILQHADVDMQRKYLPLIREATDAGHLNSTLLPLLEDRVLMKDGEDQIYGTQFFHDEAGKPALWPIRDAERVDARRAKMGLPPLADYLEKAGLSHLHPAPTRNDPPATPGQK